MKYIVCISCFVIMWLLFFGKHWPRTLQRVFNVDLCNANVLHLGRNFMKMPNFRGRYMLKKKMLHKDIYISEKGNSLSSLCKKNQVKENCKQFFKAVFMGTFSRVCFCSCQEFFSSVLIFVITHLLKWDYVVGICFFFC